MGSRWAHGYPRATADLDLVPDPDPENLDRLIAALEPDAVDSDLFGVPVRVCSLSRLREMKQAQGGAQDQADLENLPDA